MGQSTSWQSTAADGTACCCISHPVLVLVLVLVLLRFVS
jgi:hypothetical protein